MKFMVYKPIVRTVHYAEVPWWWTDDRLHDWSYHSQVNEAVERKVQELVAKHGVQDDAGYVCQWEGIQLTGSSLQSVKTAAAELAEFLTGFTGIRPL